MFANWKEKLTAKKAKNKAFEESRHWKTNTLLQDRLQAMRGSCTMVPAEIHEAVITAVNIALQENIWTEQSEIPEDFAPGMVCIVWNEAHLPVLRAPWNVVKEDLDDVRRVNSDTFLVAQSMDRILWFDSHGRIKLYSVAAED